MEINRIQFGDLSELSDVAKSLDMCIRQDSWYKLPGENNTFEMDNSRKDIVNLNTGHRSAVVSNVYREYQHKDVIDKIVESMNEANIQAHGFVDNHGDRIGVELSFDNIKGIDDPVSKQGIQPGARFKNSYNKANSVVGNAYFLRLVCTNGMVARKLIPEMSFSERHTGSIVEALPRSIKYFVGQIITRSTFIGEMAQAASKVVVNFDSREQRLQTMVALLDHAKVGEMVDTRLKTLEPTKWDIYNALTEVTSHERIGESVKDRMERMSESILDKHYHVIPAVIA